MPFLVNDELVPDGLVHAEAERLRSHPDFSGIADEVTRRMRIRAAAEDAAINRVLVAQAARKDARPIAAEDIDREIAAFRSANGQHPRFEETALRERVEARLRAKRTLEDMTKCAKAPCSADIEAFYNQYRESFRRAEMVRGRTS